MIKVKNGIYKKIIESVFLRDKDLVKEYISEYEKMKISKNDKQYNPYILIMGYCLLGNLKKMKRLLDEIDLNTASNFEEMIYNHYLGNYFVLQNELKKALRFLEYANKRVYISWKSSFLNNEYTTIYHGILVHDLGNCYLKLGELSLANEYFHRASAIFKATNCLNRYYQCEIANANIYIIRGHYNEALKLLEKFYTISEYEYYGVINSAYIYYLLNDLETAKKFMIRAKKLFKAHNDKYIECSYHITLSLIYEALGDYDKAIIHFEKLKILCPKISETCSKYFIKLIEALVKEDYSEKTKDYINDVVLKYFRKEKYRNCVDICKKYLKKGEKRKEEKSEKGIT